MMLHELIASFTMLVLLFHSFFCLTAQVCKITPILQLSRESLYQSSSLWISLQTDTTIHGGASISDSSKDNIISSPCIGIDLGTTYSCVAVWCNNCVKIRPNDQGNRITPSYVAFLQDGTGQQLVGDAAKNQWAQNPMGMIFDVKHLIGRKFTDVMAQSDKALFPFEVV